MQIDISLDFLKDVAFVAEQHRKESLELVKVNPSSSFMIASSICINLTKIKDTICYTDETWVYVDEMEGKSWYDRNLLAYFHPEKKSDESSVMVSYQFNVLCEFLGKGPILMVLHIGSKDGSLRDKGDRHVALINRGKISKRN